MSRAIRALGEVALRVRGLDRMQAFYADVLGLQPRCGTRRASTLPQLGHP
jgi:catechol-2,3-dioxygenase